MLSRLTRGIPLALNLVNELNAFALKLKIEILLEQKLDMCHVFLIFLSSPCNNSVIRLVT